MATWLLKNCCILVFIVYLEFLGICNANIHEYRDLHNSFHMVQGKSFAIGNLAEDLSSEHQRRKRDTGIPSQDGKCNSQNSQLQVNKEGFHYEVGVYILPLD